MRRWPYFLFLALAVMLASVGPVHAGYSVVDDGGRATRFEAPPARIVSLLPSLTETVCALGTCERLVGVDRYSNWPQAVQRLPQMGGGLDPSIEAVVALKPDVVLLDVATRVDGRLRALGLKVLRFKPRTQADMRRVTERLGELLQRQGQAQALWRATEAGVQAAAQALPLALRGQRVYFEVDPAPHAAGSGTFIDELLRAVGLANVIEPALGPYPRINPELIVRVDPDLIMISQQGAAELAARPGWSGLRALREGRVCEFGMAERDILVRPGPRMPEAARLMVACANGRLRSAR